MPIPATRAGLRQQLLILHPVLPTANSPIGAWCRYDGAGSDPTISGDADKPPYASVLAAMRDGWRVLQITPQPPPQPGLEHATSFLPHEWVLERLVETGHD